LQATNAAALLAAEEEEVTELLKTRLNAMLETHSLWRDIVCSVTRGSKHISFDGTHLEKQPDLSLHLTQRNASFPVIIECKVIDAKAAQDHTRYCKQGLARFVKGEYAWTTREAFMLAYVRDGSCISECLTPSLEKSKTNVPALYLVQELPVPIDLSPLDLARSVHGRGFKYPNRLPPMDDPGPIALWHLWLGAT
jgi:hypothetical protein